MTSYVASIGVERRGALGFDGTKFLPAYPPFAESILDESVGGGWHDCDLVDDDGAFIDIEFKMARAAKTLFLQRPEGLTPYIDVRPDKIVPLSIKIPRSMSPTPSYLRFEVTGGVPVNDDDPTGPQKACKLLAQCAKCREGGQCFKVTPAGTDKGMQLVSFSFAHQVFQVKRWRKNKDIRMDLRVFCCCTQHNVQYFRITVKLLNKKKEVLNQYAMIPFVCRKRTGGGSSLEEQLGLAPVNIPAPGKKPSSKRVPEGHIPSDEWIPVPKGRQQPRPDPIHSPVPKGPPAPEVAIGCATRIVPGFVPSQKVARISAFLKPRPRTSTDPEAHARFVAAFQPVADLFAPIVDVCATSGPGGGGRGGSRNRVPARTTSQALANLAIPMEITGKGHTLDKNGKKKKKKTPEERRRATLPVPLKVEMPDSERNPRELLADAQASRAVASVPAMCEIGPDGAPSFLPCQLSDGYVVGTQGEGATVGGVGTAPVENVVVPSVTRQSFWCKFAMVLEFVQHEANYALEMGMLKTLILDHLLDPYRTGFISGQFLESFLTWAGPEPAEWVKRLLVIRRVAPLPVFHSFLDTYTARRILLGIHTPPGMCAPLHPREGHFLLRFSQSQLENNVITLTYMRKCPASEVEGGGAAAVDDEDGEEGKKIKMVVRPVEIHVRLLEDSCELVIHMATAPARVVVFSDVVELMRSHAVKSVAAYPVPRFWTVTPEIAASTTPTVCALPPQLRTNCELLDSWAEKLATFEAVDKEETDRRSRAHTNSMNVSGRGVAPEHLLGL